MQLKTILNRIEPYKSFVYSKVQMFDTCGTPHIEVTVEPRANGRPICSGCHRPAPGYDRQPRPRRFEYVPLWAISVCFLYRMRRVNCATCGIKTEEVPWGDGKCHLTKSYRWFLARWAKRLSWKEVALAFHTTWENVFRAVKHAVEWGLNVIREELDQAVHVLDRFHVMKKMNEAIDQVRREEASRLKQSGYEHILKHSRWCLLKRPENLTDNQTVKLRELMKYNLGSLRARLLREDFQRFWEYSSPGWAEKFLDEWCRRTMRSRLEPMKKVAASLRRHQPLIFNWFRARGAISAGIVEGFNNKAKLTTRKAYGFRTLEAAQIALYHTLGALPEPKVTHEFC